MTHHRSFHPTPFRFAFNKNPSRIARWTKESDRAGNMVGDDCTTSTTGAIGDELRREVLLIGVGLSGTCITRDGTF